MCAVITSLLLLLCVFIEALQRVFPAGFKGFRLPSEGAYLTYRLTLSPSESD